MNYLTAASLALALSSTGFADDRPTVGEFEVNLSAFMLANLLDLEEPPKYRHAELAYRLNERTVIGIEAMAWHYYAPLGIPYGSSLGDPAENYPGYVQAAGAGLSYKQFVYRKVFLKGHATVLHQTYRSMEGKELGTGVQLFAVGRLGYQFNLLNNRLFIEPSIAVTSWPVNTGLPDGFQQQENNWPSVFVGEPGLNIGFRF